MYNGKTPGVRGWWWCAVIKYVLTLRSNPPDVPYWEGDNRVWYDEEGNKVTDDPRVCRSFKSIFGCAQGVYNTLTHAYPPPPFSITGNGLLVGREL